MTLNKLAAGIVITAIATTAISAPVKAKDNKELTTILAILAGGYVIHELADKRKKRSRETVVTPPKPRRDTSITHQHRDGTWYTHSSMADLKRYHRHKRNQRDGRAIDMFNGLNNDHHNRPIHGQLKKLPMPKKCERTVRLRNGKIKRAYRERCLLKNGYKVDRHGVVTHRNWRWLSRRPNLI